MGKQKIFSPVSERIPRQFKDNSKKIPREFREGLEKKIANLEARILELENKHTIFR